MLTSFNLFFLANIEETYQYDFPVEQGQSVIDLFLKALLKVFLKDLLGNCSL